jgi:ATP-dependent DNA helicase RecG
MRPEILYPLFAPVTSLDGVGPSLARLIERLAGPRVVDLLWHLPSGVIDRRYAPTLAQARSGTVATLTVRIEGHRPPASSRQPYKVFATDGTGTLALVFFHARRDYLNQVLPVGAVRVVSGTLERYGDELQMTHPDHIASENQRDAVMAIEPVYSLTSGLTPRRLTTLIRGALARAPELPEWQDAAFLGRHGWQPWREALGQAHAPADEADLSPAAPARQRLAYDELLANQLALALVRLRLRQLPGRSIRSDGTLARRALDTLTFRLTPSQRRAIAEITADMAAPSRMLRLLQGDVGSGKTVVAVVAMLHAVEAGFQAVMMAPTDLLARQHYATLAPLAEAAGVAVTLLTGREKGRSRDQALAGLAEGRLAMAVGTHALFQEGVAFRNLALAVIDEQHRFGVHQRLTLAAKGQAADVLVMTATPIPRTLMLTAYGDMEVSRLMDKPPGRQPIDTRVIAMERLDEVIAAIGRCIAKGAKVYWVCPLVEESAVLDLAAAEDRVRHLRDLFAGRVGLLHGRMKGAEKDAAMAAFTAGPVDILVATTVIEVGVDVPEATVMVIERAERFGLAQLHQLRGRIGRSDKPSTCILVYGQPLTEAARARLSVLRETDDGFRIAEEDLRLRGAGELLGTRQSGQPAFRLADPVSHADLLEAARDDAQLMVHRDPDLLSPRGQALRTLLYLFERDAAVRYLRSG